MVPKKFDLDPRLPHDADERDWPAFVNPDGTLNEVDEENDHGSESLIPA
jgi:hypothetical protein